MKKTNVLKELIRIIAGLVLASLPVVLICAYLRAYPMNYADGEAPYYFWNRDISNTPGEKKYRTVILGDSAANAAYLPEVLSEDTISLALGGTTPVENYYVLSDWIVSHGAPEHVFLSFMDYHMIYDNMFYERTVYAHRLTPEQEREILARAEEYGDENIAVSDAQERLFQYDHYLPKMYLPALLNAGFSMRREENLEHYAAIDAHRGAYIGLSNVMYLDTDPNRYESYLVNPLYDEYYRRILDLCQQKGISVHMVSLPKTGNSVLSEQFHRQRDGYYEGLAEEYSCAEYEAGIETMDNRCFLDWEHFNIYGAFEYSSILRKKYPDAFAQQSPGRETLNGLLSYLKMMREPDLLLKNLDSPYFSAILITDDANLAARSGAEDTGKEFAGRHVWLKSSVLSEVSVNENDGRNTSAALAGNEDGTQALRLGETWIPVTIEDYAGASVILISHSDESVAEVRNYLSNGGGYLIKQAD